MEPVTVNLVGLEEFTSQFGPFGYIGAYLIAASFFTWRLVRSMNAAGSSYQKHEKSIGDGHVARSLVHGIVALTNIIAVIIMSCQSFSLALAKITPPDILDRQIAVSEAAFTAQFFQKLISNPEEFESIVNAMRGAGSNGRGGWNDTPSITEAEVAEKVATKKSQAENRLGSARRQLRVYAARIEQLEGKASTSSGVRPSFSSCQSGADSLSAQIQLLQGEVSQLFRTMSTARSQQPEQRTAAFLHLAEKTYGPSIPKSNQVATRDESQRQP